MENINVIVNYVIIAIFLYNIFRGYQKGFIRQAAALISTLLAFIISPILAPVIKEILIQLNAKNVLVDFIHEYISAYQYSHLISGSKLITETLGKSPAVVTDSIAQKVLSQNAALIAVSIINISAYIVSYIIIRIILSTIFNVSSAIASLPLIRQFDKLIGALAGGLLTALALWIIITVISLLSFVPQIDKVNVLAHQLPVLRTFYIINPFQLLVKTIQQLK